MLTAAGKVPGKERTGENLYNFVAAKLSSCDCHYPMLANTCLTWIIAIVLQMIQYLQPTPLLLTCQPIRSKQFEELTNQITRHNSSNRTNSDIQSSSDRVSDPEFLQSWRPSLVNIWDSCTRLETADTRLSSAGITASQARLSVRTKSFYKVYNFADSCKSISGWCPFVYCISCKYMKKVF